MAKKRITLISETDRNAVKRKSAAMLPDSPADHGMKAGAIKPRFWQALIQGDDSIAGLINRVIGEINLALKQSDEEYAESVTDIAYDRARRSFTVTFGDGKQKSLDRDMVGNGIEHIEKTESEGLLDIYTITMTNGDTATFTVKNGERGEQGAPGERGPQGEKGDGLSIAKIYGSVAEMQEGFATDEVPLDAFVLISTGNVADEENARIYRKGKEAYIYVTDLSGEPGYTPQRGTDYWTAEDVAAIVASAVAQIREEDHGVGSWLFTDDPTDPAEKYGGKWEQIADRSLVGAGGKYAVGDTGGVDEVALTSDQMPSHNHNPIGYGSWGDINTDHGGPGFTADGHVYVCSAASRSDTWPVGMTGYTGGNEAHENRSPFHATYIWHRFA